MKEKKRGKGATEGGGRWNTRALAQSVLLKILEIRNGTRNPLNTCNGPFIHLWRT